MREPWTEHSNTSLLLAFFGRNENAAFLFVWRIIEVYFEILFIFSSPRKKLIFPQNLCKFPLSPRMFFCKKNLRMLMCYVLTRKFSADKVSLFCFKNQFNAFVDLHMCFQKLYFWRKFICPKETDQNSQWFRRRTAGKRKNHFACLCPLWKHTYPHFRAILLCAILNTHSTLRFGRQKDSGQFPILEFFGATSWVSETFTY